MKCLIVDDSAAFLTVARLLLEREDVTVVGTASSSNEALDLLAGLQPDVVLVDVNLGDESGFDVARSIHETAGPKRTPVILISTHDEDDYVELIEASPAIGFVSKPDLSAAAIRRLLANGA